MPEAYSGFVKGLTKYGCTIISPIAADFIKFKSTIIYRCSQHHENTLKCTSLSNLLNDCKKKEGSTPCKECSANVTNGPLLKKIHDVCDRLRYTFLSYNASRHEIMVICNCGAQAGISTDNLLKPDRTPTCKSCRNFVKLGTSHSKEIVEVPIILVDEENDYWRPIRCPKYPSLGKRYLVSRDGQVKNMTSTILKSCEKDGYLYYSLVTSKGTKFLSSHKLVAMTFLPDPKSDQNQVNHKNGNKKDNNVENLEWVSQSENIQHSYNRGLHPGSGRTIIQMTLDGAEIGRFKSISEASRQLGIDGSSITKACRGKYSRAGQYTWKYMDQRVSIIEESFVIPGTQDSYRVSKSGRVYSLRNSNEEMMPSNRDGYKRLRLVLAGNNRKPFSVHTLVAITFLTDTMFKGCVVDHLNGLRNDNRLDNLQVVSNSVNVKRGLCSGKDFTIVTATDKKGNVYKFRGLEEAVYKLLIDRDTIIDRVFNNREYKGWKLDVGQVKVKVTYKDRSWKIFGSLVKASQSTKVLVRDILHQVEVDEMSFECQF